MRERGETERETYINTHCRLLTSSMIDSDLRTVGMVARTASTLLLCTSLGPDGSSSAKRTREKEEKWRIEVIRQKKNKIKMGINVELY